MPSEQVIEFLYDALRGGSAAFFIKMNMIGKAEIRPCAHRVFGIPDRPVDIGKCIDLAAAPDPCIEPLPDLITFISNRIVGKMPKTKKAIVTLTADSKDIEIFEGL